MVVFLLSFQLQWGQICWWNFKICISKNKFQRYFGPSEVKNPEAFITGASSCPMDLQYFNNLNHWEWESCFVCSGRFVKKTYGFSLWPQCGLNKLNKWGVKSMWIEFWLKGRCNTHFRQSCPFHVLYGAISRWELFEVLDCPLETSWMCFLLFQAAWIFSPETWRWLDKSTLTNPYPFKVGR